MRHSKKATASNEPSSPQQRLQSIIKANGKVQEADIAAVFDQLKPIEPEFLIGDWQGGSFDTGHPSHALLLQSNWAGKRFRSIDDVDPVMVYRDGARVWEKRAGNARIREVKFRGVVSAAMVYDTLPIIDSFRYVADDMVLGAMDSKMNGDDAGTYFFYLKRMGSKL
ncbi:hypothetical protein B0I35DRAFT_360058 [Stachybotrys elegans]|uniref:GXWXG domain-containing protein n=1 Tax=Stachybotrys elegans TaxID=80388 RepID=A0A8K0SIZ2_9HYPO|nr:hypothetical protein B0I35DRAFT_360058 [Stachybotrys elegans]